jgi:hypothetical protein
MVGETGRATRKRRAIQKKISQTREAERLKMRYRPLKATEGPGRKCKLA